MSIEEQNDVKKAMRTEYLIKDAVKGGVLAIALYVLWGAYMEQNKYIITEVESLRKQVVDCNSEKNNRIQQGIDYIIKQVDYVNDRGIK